MLRHMYNFWLKPPSPLSLFLSASTKVHFYCNVVVVYDKYGLPALGNEARKGLNTFVVSLESPETVVTSLKIITEEYCDHKSLENCAVNLANPHLKELAAVADFPDWLASQPQFLQGIVEDAAKLRSLQTPPSSNLKTMPKYKCRKSFCSRLRLAWDDSTPPNCHGLPAVQDGVVYCEES